MYGFSEFASSLNEPEDGVAPTDSRLRPDQRIMEEQDFNRANEEKVESQNYICCTYPRQTIQLVHTIAGLHDTQTLPCFLIIGVGEVY